LSRDKSNLAGFFYDCVAGADLGAVRSILREPHVGRYLRQDVLSEMLANPPGRESPHHLRWVTDVWWTVATECWLRQHDDPGFVEELRSTGLSEPATAVRRRQ
jgi:hypothetical protein